MIFHDSNPVMLSPSPEVSITSLTSLIIGPIILLKVPISVKSVTNSKDTSIFRISDLGSLEGVQFKILDDFVSRIADFFEATYDILASAYG